MTTVSSERIFQYDLPAHPTRQHAGTPFLEYRRLADGQLITEEQFRTDPAFEDTCADMVFGSDLFIERVSAEFPVTRVEGDLGTFGVVIFTIDMDGVGKSMKVIAARIDAIAAGVGFRV